MKNLYKFYAKRLIDLVRNGALCFSQSFFHTIPPATIDHAWYFDDKPDDG